MNEYEANERLCVHIRGTMYFHGNTNSKFSGPVKRGLRLLLWGNSDKKATSCSFVNDLSISIGESKVTEVIILSPKSIDKKIKIGDNYAIGFPQIKIGEFKISEILGEWKGKVP